MILLGVRQLVGLPYVRMLGRLLCGQRKVTTSIVLV